jgi:NAD dependent epimerase/dehydratase
MNMSSARALVTGADGFIGSHLTEMLVKKGVKVRALSQYNSLNQWGWLDSIDCLDSVEVVSGDIRDGNFVDTISKDIDVVFHLAALIAIPYSYLAPDSYVQTNISGTLNVVQAAMRNSVSKVIHTSTSEVYGTARYAPINENHPLQPQSPYSASKIGADAMAMSFFHAFELPVAIARPFNTYGPRQSARAVIPTIISQILTGQSEIKLGSLSPTRDFNYVEDTCGGLIALAECDASVGNTTNIGSGSEISIGELANILKEMTGSAIEIVSDEKRSRPAGSEVERLLCDCEKFFEMTGYKPRTPIREGLSKTLEWFGKAENLKRYKAGIYNV